MNRAEVENQLSQAKTIADIIRALAACELAEALVPGANCYAWLVAELDIAHESIEEHLWSPPEQTSKAVPPVPPPMPPLTQAEVESNERITATLQELVPKLRQRNLDNAVILARLAAEGRGPLVEHFAELGRRFGDAPLGLGDPIPSVVEGGAERSPSAGLTATPAMAGLSRRSSWSSRR